MHIIRNRCSISAGHTYQDIECSILSGILSLQIAKPGAIVTACAYNKQVLQPRAEIADE